MLLSLAGGAALFLAFPPYGLWPLALFGYVPVVVAQFRVLPARISSLATGSAIGLWLGVYMGPVFEPMGGIAVWIPLLIAAVVVVLDIGQREFHDKTRYHLFVIAGVATWSGFEMIRLLIPFMGSWAFIAYPFHEQAWLLQPVSVLGSIAMGAVVVALNYSLALASIRWLDDRVRFDRHVVLVPARFSRRWLVGSGSAAAAWIAWSLILFLSPGTQETITVAAIQPEAAPIVSANAGDNAAAERLYEQMIDQTRSAARDGAQLVVWPEGSLSWDPQVDDRLELGQLARDEGIHLALGYVVYLERGFRNESTIIDPSGAFLGVFGKDHPVVLSGETSLSRGTYPVFESDIAVLGTIICFDLDFTDTARKISTQGAQVIAVPSNDWPGIATKHYTHVVFRAVENGVPMIKADGGFDSVIVDGNGRIAAKAVFPQGGAATLVAEVPLGSGTPTLYARTGDWVGWLFLAILAVLTLGAPLIVRRYAPRNQGPHAGSS